MLEHRLNQESLTDCCNKFCQTNDTKMKVNHKEFKQGVENDFSNVIKPVKLNGIATWEFNSDKVLLKLSNSSFSLFSNLIKNILSTIL